MTPSTPTPPAEADRIELNGGCWMALSRRDADLYRVYDCNGLMIGAIYTPNARAFAAAQRPAAPSQNDLHNAMQVWRDHGGTSHGPNTETLSIPLHQFGSFIAALGAQRPAAPVDRETLVGLAEKGTDDWFHGKGAPRRVECIADAILAYLSAQPRVAVPEELRAAPLTWERDNDIYDCDLYGCWADTPIGLINISDMRGYGRDLPYSLQLIGNSKYFKGYFKTAAEARIFAEARLNDLVKALTNPTTDAGSAER